MFSKIRFALASFMIIAGLSWGGVASAAGDGAISGQVVDKTAGVPVGSINVALTTYVGGKATSDPQKATTDSAGKFTFKGLSFDATITYAVGTTFQDADYNSPTITLTLDNSSQTVQLDVYESTTSDENIQVSNGHIVVFAEQGHLEVLEVWRFSNVGNKTYIGTNKNTLRFSLPAGATSLTPAQGAVVEGQGGAFLAAPVPPGFTDVNFTYFIPFESSSVAITRNTDYPIADFALLVQDNGVKVTSKFLTAAASQNINGNNYLDLRASNVVRGTALDASFTSVPKAQTESGESSRSWLWLLIGFGLLGLVVAIAYPRLRNRPETAGAAADDTPADSKDALLNELARLDNAHEAGAIEENKYRENRARLKSRLMQIYSQTQRD